MVTASKWRRTTLAFSSLLAFVLIGGCAKMAHFLERDDKAPVCFNPGAVAEKNNCYYVLQIVQHNPDDTYRVLVPDAVLIHNGKHSTYLDIADEASVETNINKYARIKYDIKVDNPDRIDLKDGFMYEFRTKKGQTAMEVKKKVTAEELPPNQGQWQGKDPDKDPGGVSMNNGGTELYASHSPQCCMCDKCQSGCYCPGQAGCPWCAAADVNTVIASLQRNNDGLDVRSGHRPSRLGVAEKFLALISGSRSSGNISAKSIAAYHYDPNFAPKCLTTNT